MNVREEFPGITKAALAISYDNGGINRDRSEALMLNELRRFLNNHVLPCGLRGALLKEIDEWLATLDDESLDIVCCGEQSEQDEILGVSPAHTDEILTAIFDNVC